MGCVPDRTLAKYKTFQNDGQPNKNYAELSSINRGSHLSLNSNDPNINYRPFAKVYRSGAKRSAISPVKLNPQLRSGRKKPDYFSLEKTQWNNVEQKVVAVKRERNKSGRNSCRTKGAIMEIPHRQHIITCVETPSESAKTSFLSKLEKHPSNFFIANNDNDFDLIFRSNLIEKPEQSTASVIIPPPEESIVKE